MHFTTQQPICPISNVQCGMYCRALLRYMEQSWIEIKMAWSVPLLPSKAVPDLQQDILCSIPQRIVSVQNVIWGVYQDGMLSCMIRPIGLALLFHRPYTFYLVYYQFDQLAHNASWVKFPKAANAGKWRNLSYICIDGEAPSTTWEQTVKLIRNQTCLLACGHS